MDNVNEIAERIAHRLGNGQSKLDTRLHAIEQAVALIQQRLTLPCPKHEDLVKDIEQIKTRQNFFYPLVSAVVGGVIVGVITIVLRVYIK